MDVSTRKQTILLADDDCSILALVKIFLENAGYTVLTAGDGEETFGVFQRNQDSIELLLSDVMMPRMGGLRLASAAHTVRPRLPVLFISGDRLDADWGWGCVAKPFHQANL
jgi:CheY-like chemotaxis protein